MKRSFVSLALGSVLLSACVPGPELIQPPVEGTITDARTHRPVAGAQVTVVKNQEVRAAKIPWQKPQDLYSASNDTVEESATVRSLPSTSSDARGHFSLAAHYKFGLILIYGDPMSSPITVHIRQAGFQPLDISETYNFQIRPFSTLRVDAALVPESSVPATVKRPPPSHLP